MANIVKKPNPSNFRSGKVCVSPKQVEDLKVGDTLTVLKHDSGELFFTKSISQKMINSLEDKGAYFLMTYKDN